MGQKIQSMDQTACPLCQTGTVTEQKELTEYSYGGYSAMLPMHFRSCNHCGSDFSGAEDCKRGAVAIQNFRNSVEAMQRV